MNTFKPEDAYKDGEQPCLVAKLPCGHYIAACTLDEPHEFEEAIKFRREMEEAGASRFVPSQPRRSHYALVCYFED